MRRLTFWLGVAGVSVIANLAVAAAANTWPNSAVAKFEGRLNSPTRKAA